jgi:hypothetical protein
MLGRLRNLFGRAEPVPNGMLAQTALADLAGQPAEVVNAAPPPPDAWSATRISVVENLWGPGFIFPGGAKATLRLAAPFGLSESLSVLLIGSQLGGPVQALTEEFKCWVAGYEADAALAALAAARLTAAGGDVARRASVARWNPAAPGIKKRGFHRALAIDVIRDDASSVALASIAQALKPDGHCAVIQTVRGAGDGAVDPALAAWARLEQRDAALPTTEGITATLEKQRFDVRTVEDVSDRHCSAILRGWATLVESLDGPRPEPVLAAALVREAEQWMRRLRLIQSGRIRLVRWHAIVA